LYPYNRSAILQCVKYAKSINIVKEIEKQIETKNVFLDKNIKTQKKIKHKNSCRSRELNPGPFAPQADASPQLRVTIVVKLFNCFDAMDRNLNKQSRICGPHIFNKFIFMQYFNMHGLPHVAVSRIYGSRYQCLNNG